MVRGTSLPRSVVNVTCPREKRVVERGDISRLKPLLRAHIVPAGRSGFIRDSDHYVATPSSEGMSVTMEQSTREKA